MLSTLQKSFNPVTGIHYKETSDPLLCAIAKPNIPEDWFGCDRVCPLYFHTIL
ncbi:hypothetical protein [Coleofasciculus sp. A1-SPW-01]|uniref:hypothetical protein n=1 Tax=Coleofasciculus sp. A1-SPW-01 TaxID=3070819 RepID=UPI000304B1CA